MTPRHVVAILATMDTKQEEALFLRRCLRVCDARIVDAGTRADPRPPLADPDVPRRDVAAAAGVSLGMLQAMRRDEAMAAMGRGAGVILASWLREGRLAGVIGIGGNQGTSIASIAMRALPFGVPKILVSTVASGDVRPFVGCGDTALLFSVGDLFGGPNRVTGPVLRRAAGMLLGALDAAEPAPDGAGGTAAIGPGGGPAVAITALGNTHDAVARVMARLRARCYEPIPFHASGAGGSAMEDLVRSGMFAAVIDLSPHEFLAEVLGDDIYAPVGPRLVAAGEAGIPQIVAPGGLDYFVFGPPDRVPSAYRGRPTHYHNPYNTNVRATAAELARLGEALAARLNAARGPATFCDPLRGWSYIGCEGGPLWDPDANEAFRASLRRRLRPEVRYLAVDAAINDAEFADAVLAVADDVLPRRAAPA